MDLGVELTGMGSLWLKASATWGRIILVEGLHDLGGGPWHLIQLYIVKIYYN
jgi:hypothetical protein